nr:MULTISPECIES: C40 family peptidase [unclassified Exiguobacterium]
MTGTKKPPLYDSTGKQYVRYNHVSIYSAPSTSTRVTRLKRGQVVETFGTSGYYSRILVGGSYRYIATNYLTLNKPTAKLKAGTVFYVQLNDTPYFHTDVTYTKPAGTLKRGTKLIGLRSIDDDFWYAKLPSGKKVYVLNPYIAQTKPKSIKVQRVKPALHYATTKRTAFYANANDKTPIGYLDANIRVYPRGKSGDSYLIQYDWRPVYVKTTTIRVKQDPLTIKRGNSQKERFIAAAVNQLGTPYTWGSQSPRNGGFDCSGLIHYAANQAGKIGGRANVSGYWYGNHFKQRRTSFTSGKRGDIIFFAGTYRNGPSHIGIMLSNEFFIHAGGETLQINSIHDPQWRPYFLGYKSL